MKACVDWTLLASAPQGMEHLRGLLVQLAVEGKLVACRPDESPVDQLLTQLQDARDAYYSTSGQRPAKQDGAVVAAPFELPSHWRWTSLAQLAHPQAGFAFKSSGFNESGDGLPLIRIRDVGQEFSGTYYCGEYRDEFVVRRGDYLISMDGEFRVAEWMHDEALLNQRVTRLQFFQSSVDRRFIALSLQCRLHELQGVKTYTTVDHLSGGQIANAPIGLPPLEEQQRIVAKVDELMALCDRLEARQQDAEAAHARLVQALLDSLTQARDAEEFQACWRRLAGQFEALLTTDASVEQLEAVVLQLAVTGRLTSQGKSFEAQADDAPDLPPLVTGWAYRAFNDLIDPQRPIAYGVLVPGPEVAGGVPFVRIADLSLQSPADLPEKTIAHDVDVKFSRTRLVGGEILMGVVGSVGKLGIAPASWAGANIARAICRIVPAHGVNKDYVLLLLRSDLMRRQFLGDTRTLAQPTLNVGLIRTAKAPVPPLEEQGQVVHMAHELLALCDQLKARIAAASAKHAQLAEALVAQAVAA